MVEERPEESRIPEATEEDVQKVMAELEEQPREESTSGEMGDVGCPECGGTMHPSHDLTFDVNLEKGRVIIPNLSGHKCERCGDQYFDDRSSDIIDRYTAEEALGGHEIKITTVGGGKLGIYFPKDVLRDMDITSERSVILKPISRKKALLEL